MEVRCGVQRYMLPPSFPIFQISGSQISDFRSQVSDLKPDPGGDLKPTPHVNERLPGGSSERKDPRAHHATTRLRCSPPDEHGSVEAEERHKNQPNRSPGGVRSSAIQERRLRQARGPGSQVLTAVRYFRIMVAQAAPSPQRKPAEDAVKSH